MTNHAVDTSLIDDTVTSNLSNTAGVLAAARSDIHNAVAAADNPHRRQQHALAARDNAVAVLLANDATLDEIRHAEYYLADAEAFIAATD